MRISDWSSDVCSSDLRPAHRRGRVRRHDLACHQPVEQVAHGRELLLDGGRAHLASQRLDPGRDMKRLQAGERCDAARRYPSQKRSEEHTSELQSLMRISYAVFCLKKKKKITHNIQTHNKTD